MRCLTLSTIVCIALTAMPGIAAERIEFEPVAGFPDIPPNVSLGRCSGVAVDSRAQVYLFHRGKPPILCFDRSGRFMRSWGDDLIHSAHSLRIDRDDNVWVTDIGHHLVMQFDPQGKLLLALGTSDKPGTGNDQFDKPTDIAFGNDGQVYVSDGYGNSRVMEFDGRGKFVRTWGRPGMGPGEFKIPHAVRVDPRGRVLVADRENKRSQVFNGQGTVESIWDGFAPYGLELDPSGAIFVADGLANQVLQLGPDGKVVHSWGGKGNQPGQFNLPHMLALDRDGNLFVTEIDGMRMQKFTRKR